MHTTFLAKTYRGGTTAATTTDNTLFSLTSIKYRPATVDDSYYDYMHGTRGVVQKWQLLLSKIIKTKHNPQGADIYQLSLFGVLFLLKLIRQNDINRLRHGLYNNDKSFLEYCDIIADKYSHTIPLIFKKWRSFEDLDAMR